MSTEAETPKVEKTTKSKDEKRSKKRKHQADEAATAGASEPVSTKKQKKKHSKKNEPTEAADGPVVEQPDTNGEASPTKSQSKLVQKANNKIKRKQKEDKPVDDGEIPAVLASSSKATANGTDATIQDSDISEGDLVQQSPFVQQTSSLYLPLSPMAHNFPVAGLCGEHISPHLLSYYAPLKGVIMDYSNPRLSETLEEAGERSRSTDVETSNGVLAQSIDEYAVTFVWMTADYTLFRPRKGTVLEGYINVQNESVLGLVCYNYFNAGVERQRLPKDWQWVGGERQGRKKEGEDVVEGYYVDGLGKKVEGRVVFRVVDFQANGGSEVGGGSIDIVGSLLSKEEDAKMEEDSRRDMAKNGKGSGRRLGA